MPPANIKFTPSITTRPPTYTRSALTLFAGLCLAALSGKTDMNAAARDRCVSSITNADGISYSYSAVSKAVDFCNSIVPIKYATEPKSYVLMYLGYFIILVGAIGLILIWSERKATPKTTRVLN
ncbi:hypothetical protein ACFSR9_15245 [Deinococcus taklimakanensis]|uniref:Uncharacterized protein n=1 Tax=Deinococcus taklimakanensis TaxID=536443 RepID=A0ABW5P6C8_9DEIO